MREYSYRRRKRRFRLFAIYLLMLSASFVLMPTDWKFYEVSKLPQVITGLLFWGGLIGTAATAASIDSSRRASTVFKEMYPELKKVGLFHFFQNRYAVAADVVLFVSLASFLPAQKLGVGSIVQFSILAIIVFSFGMHCMLNGIDFIYVNHRARRGRVS